MYYLKWIWSNIATIRGGFALAILFMLIETGSGISTTYIQKFLIDDVFIGGRHELFPLYLSLFAMAFIVSSSFFTIAAYRYVYNEYVMDDILLLRMLRRFFRIPMSRLQNERTARYVDYITKDLHNGGSMIGYQSPNGIQRTLHVLVLIGIVGWYSPFLLLTVTLFSTAYFAGSQYFAKRIKAVHREVQDSRTKLSVHLEESVSATRETIAYHRTAWEAKVYQALYKEYFDKVIQEAKEQNKQTVFIDPLRWAVTLAILGLGGYQLFTERMTLGAFVIVFQFTNQLMESFQRLFVYIMDISGMLANIDRMELLMKEEQIDPGTTSLHEPVRSIRFERVGFSYVAADRLVLQDLTLEIPAGCKVAFVGASGGGKSTIAQLLVRFYEPGAGQITVNGWPLNEIRLEDWSRRVRIVFQEPYMMANTVRTNLVFGRDRLGEGDMEDVCRSVQLYDDVAKLPNRFEEEIGERGVQLSGGQKQRLALARALLDDPEILILDEATSSLDLETERRLQARLDELRKGKTTIIIAHRLSTVRNADLIYVMDGGRIVEQGTHDELMSRGRVYPSLVMAQNQTGQDNVISSV